MFDSAVALPMYDSLCMISNLALLCGTGLQKSLRLTFVFQGPPNFMSNGAARLPIYDCLLARNSNIELNSLRDTSLQI